MNDDQAQQEAMDTMARLRKTQRRLARRRAQATRTYLSSLLALSHGPLESSPIRPSITGEACPGPSSVVPPLPGRERYQRTAPRLVGHNPGGCHRVHKPRALARVCPVCGVTIPPKESTP